MKQLDLLERLANWLESLAGGTKLHPDESVKQLQLLEDKLSS